MSAQRAKLRDTMLERMKIHKKMSNSVFAPYRELNVSYDMSIFKQRYSDAMSGQAQQRFAEIRQKEEEIAKKCARDPLVLQKHIDRKLARDNKLPPARKMTYDKQTRGSPSRLANAFVEDYRPRMMELRSIS